MKYHFIPVRMAIMKNRNDNKHKGNPCTLEYKCSLAHTMENNLQIPQKFTNRATI
jgi:hypothetical protein